MLLVNPFYSILQPTYLFQKVSRIVEQFKKESPEIPIISLGIGDVTQALPSLAIEALHNAVDEMAHANTFHGYGPEQGYDFLRTAIAKYDFQENLLSIDASEIFVSDGSKCDIANFQELFSPHVSVAIPDPVYPVYLDTNVMAGRSGQWKNDHYENIIPLPATKENNYIPLPPELHVDVIYLCFPNNPTGSAATKEVLEQFVDYAREHKALILFDAAYESFIRHPDIPHSIYEIKGAHSCAIEFRSLSKSAGFTGLRCAYTVVPHACMIYSENGEKYSLNKLWNRRQSTKFNGVAYPIQKAAAAMYTPSGQAQIRELTDSYLKNARIIRSTLEECTLTCTGGIHSPYIWTHTGQDSWDFFQHLLEHSSVICTPGDGFGLSGKEYVRFSALNTRTATLESVKRIRKALA